MRSSYPYCILLVFICLLPSGVSRADTVFLKDGTKRVGKIISQTRKQIRIRTVQGALWVIPKAQIQRLSFGKVDMKLLKEEERRAALLRKRREEEQREQAKIRIEKTEDKRTEEDKRAREEAKRREAARRKRTQATGTQGNITRTDALWRSALIPGWGQWERGEKQKGGLFVGGAVLGVFALYETNRLMLNSVRDYNALANPLSENTILLAALGFPTAPSGTQLADPVLLTLYNQQFVSQRAKIESQYGDVRLAQIALILIYSWNLMDAWFFHPTRTAKGSPAKPFTTLASASGQLRSWMILPLFSRDVMVRFAGFRNRANPKSLWHGVSFTHRVDL